MDKKINKGKLSNYEITLNFSPEEKTGARKTVLEYFAKDMKVPGFREGKVPMHIVEQKVEAGHINMAIIEHLVNKAIQSIVQENKELKLIGEPYGFDTKEDGDKTIVSFALDVYPEVEVEGKNWEKTTMDAIAVLVEEKEIQDSLLNIQKNYADYQNTDIIDEKNTISKLGLEFFDEKGESIEKGVTYLGESEFNESPFWKKTFEGKKRDEVIELSYDEKKLPEVMQAKQAGAKTLKVTIQDVKKVVLPEFTDEMILKMFGKDAEVKNYEELKAYIEKEIAKQKKENSLIQTVEKYINDVRASGIKVSIPKTMIDEEFKVRMQNLEKRLGSREKVEEYFKQLGEKAQEFVEGIRTAAGESLEKFFILNKITELLGIAIDWENEKEQFAVEKKLYEKLVGPLSEGEEKKEKKAPAKKTTPKKTDKDAK